jgi:hypothetical protein
LTPPLFTSAAPFEPQRVHAVAIYCSDGRFGDAVDEFLHLHLGLPNYDRLAIAGGPAWLTYRSSAGLLQYGFVREQLDFMVQEHGLQRAILITHYGCAHYLRRLAGDAESALPIQIQDLHDAAAMLRGWHPALQIETYLARVEGGRVQFGATPGG